MAEYKFKERDEDNLNLILDYCDRIIERTTAVKDLKEFSENAVLRDAILMNIIQIGEAVNRLSDECAERISYLPLRSIVGTRNRVVHGYEDINDEIIWNVIIKDVPALKIQLEEKLV